MPLMELGLCSAPARLSPHTLRQNLWGRPAQAAQCLSLVLYGTEDGSTTGPQTKGKLKPGRRLPIATASQSCEELFSLTACWGKIASVTGLKLIRTGDRSGEEKATTVFISMLGSTLCSVRQIPWKRCLLQGPLKEGTAFSHSTLGCEATLTMDPLVLPKVALPSQYLQ